MYTTAVSYFNVTTYSTQILFPHMQNIFSFLFHGMIDPTVKMNTHSILYAKRSF